jgi:hypothetical protein
MLTVEKGFPADPGGRVPELDGLRGLAILLVIVCLYVYPRIDGDVRFDMITQVRDRS